MWRGVFRFYDCPEAFLQRELAGADADLRDFHACQIRHGEQQVAVGSLFSTAMWRLPFSRPLAPPISSGRRIVPVVGVAVAHAAAEVDERTIQQRAVAIGRRFEFADELRELRPHDRW